MKFNSFEIKNFKGIEHAIVDLRPAGSNIFSLIGLNESGKTTILEAISKFSILREDTRALYEPQLTKEDPTEYVPKHRKSNFTGRITIRAHVSFDEGEKERIVEIVNRAQDVRIVSSSVPDEMIITRGWEFENSDYKRFVYEWPMPMMGRSKGARKEKPIEHADPARVALTEEVVKHVPQIIYFPTFLFVQPERVILNPTGEEQPVNKLYRQIIENVGKSLESPLDIQKHIVDRILTPETLAQQMVAIMLLAPDKQKQITAALNELSAHLTETVFESWSKIFGGNFSGREIVLRPGVESTNPNQKKVYVEFSLKDGTSQYDISERSLGFRWFFAFLLFTLYRVSASKNRPTLFLLDEPASNLHSRAQMQLLESLPKIATGSNQIMYSTHSHYMINPEWLDQAFIVSNIAIDYDDVSETMRQRPRGTDVKVEKYRRFVGQNPDKTTYFQPVLDKLEVVPSRFDMLKPSIVVEGKGDYLILEYGRRVLLKTDSQVAVVPTRGTSGTDEIVGLFLGWGVPFAICLDGDEAGKVGKKRYLEDWGLSASRVFTLHDIGEPLNGKTIEGLLSVEDLKLIATHYELEKRPTKSQIQLFFSEKLARREFVDLSSEFLNRIAAFERVVVGALST